MVFISTIHGTSYVVSVHYCEAHMYLLSHRSFYLEHLQLDTGNLIWGFTITKQGKIMEET